jgi:hypothetical protein
MFYLFLKFIFRNFGALAGILAGFLIGYKIGIIVLRTSPYDYWWLPPACGMAAAAAIAPFTKEFFDRLFPRSK